MAGQLQLALLGALPALLAMAFVDLLDAKRPEPRRTLRLVALAGGLSALPAIGLGEVLAAIAPAGLGAPSSYLGALYFSVIIVAVPEEAGKLAAVLAFAWRRPEC